MSAPASLQPDRVGEIRADDGTRLPYQLFGEGPALVLANGIGVRWPGLARQVAALRERCRVVCWDYRGLGSARLPRPDSDVSMARHAADALALLDGLGIQRALFAGWSMGVQVSLETIRRAPERVAGFAAILGTHGQPFRGAFPGPAARAAEAAFRLAVRWPVLGQLPLELAMGFPGLTFAWLSRVAFLGRDAERPIFESNVRNVAEADRLAYQRTMVALAEHSARDLLPRVRCPALIVCGTRDWLTPPRVAREMADLIPGAEYREIAGGTHFALIEQPALLNRWLLEFVDRVHGAG